MTAARRSTPPVRFPPGHYYSPMYDARELAAPRGDLAATRRPTPDIDWREEAQLSLCERGVCRQQPLELAAPAGRRRTVYWADNDQYPPLDAWVLAGSAPSPAPGADDRGRFGILLADHGPRQPRGARRLDAISSASSRIPGVPDGGRAGYLRAARGAVQDTPLELSTSSAMATCCSSTPRTPSRPAAT